MSSAQEEKKPSTHITLKVKNNSNGNELAFRVKRHTKLKELMNAYCDHQKIQYDTLVFLLDGKNIKREQTPDELKMEDNDVIDAMLHMNGGSRITKDMKLSKLERIW